MTDVPELTPTMAIESGGWDARYARVLRIAQIGKAAFVLMDPNGDGAETYAEVWSYDEEDGWGFASGTGAGRFDGDGTWGETGGTNMGIAFLAGEAEPQSKVTIAFRNDLHEVTTDANGIWVFVASTSDNELGDEFPARAD